MLSSNLQAPSTRSYGWGLAVSLLLSSAPTLANWIPYGGLENGCNQGPSISDVAIAPDGTLYACGGQVTMCAGTTARGLVRLPAGAVSWSAVPDVEMRSAECRISIRGNRLVLGQTTGGVGSAPVISIVGLGAVRMATLDLSTQTWSTMGAGVNGPIHDFEWLNENQLFVGGAFTSAGASQASNIASFDFASSAWNAHAMAVNGTVLDLEIEDGRLFAAGRFTQISGVSAANIASKTLPGGTWTPHANTISPSAEVSGIAVDAASVYAVGTFTSIDGVAARRAARSSIATPGTWAALDLPVTFSADSIVQNGATVYVSGGPGTAILALGADPCGGVCWTEVGTGSRFVTSGSNTRAYAAGGSLFVFGNFWRINGVRTNGIARFTPQVQNPLTGTWSGLGSIPTNAVSRDEGAALSRVRVLRHQGARVFAGGFFEEIGGVASAGFAMRTPGGWVDLSNASRADAPRSANAIALLETGDVIVAGEWAPSGGGFNQNISTCNPDSFVCTTLAGGVNNRVDAVFVDGPDVWVGGVFSGPRIGTASPSVAVFSRSTNSWRSFPNVIGGGGVLDFEKIGSDIYVAGNFTSVNGNPIRYIARYDSGGNWSGLGSGIASGAGVSVNDLLAVDGQLYVTGNFSSAGGAASRGIARFDPVTQQWTGLGPGLNAPATAGGLSLNRFGDWLYVGGRFDQAGGIMAGNIAAWDLIDQRWQSVAQTGVSEPFFTSQVSAISSGSELIVGGDFVEVDGQVSSNIAGLRSEIVFRSRFE